MKQRIISALIAIAIALYPLIFGGITLELLVAFIAVVAAYEFIKVSCGQLDLPLFISVILFIALSILIPNYSFAWALLDIIWLFFLAVYFEKYSYALICEVFVISLVITCAIATVAFLYHNSKPLLFYMLLIAALGADTFAYFGGFTFKKLGLKTHKMNERVSPKKTIEGALIGWLLGGLAAFGFAASFNYLGYELWEIAILACFLPLVSQVGDLSFSLIKRHYGVKDFGNIMPGHGGVLDRLDSVLFCLVFLRAMMIIL